ncbi:MAG: HEAT repeat domain-containing protein [Polyangia bacterium]
MAEPRARGRLVALVAALLMVGSALGCHARNTAGRLDYRPLLGTVAVTRASAATVDGQTISVDAVALAAKARQAIGRSRVFAPAESDRPKPRANVTIAVDVLGEGEPPNPEIAVRVRVRIEVVPNSAETAHYGEDAAAIGQLPTAQNDLVASVFQRLAERTTEDLLAAYADRQRLWLATDGDIAKTLASDNPELRLEAIRITGARKLKAQLPTLLHLLVDDDEVTRDAALGAVVAIGDRTAVRTLTESRQMRDSYEMSKILDAVASLGGQEATQYLSFVSETHDDPDVRKVAEAALNRLRKREVKQEPTK